MRNLTITKHPEDSFWMDYTDLWQNSIGRSPFQSPGIMKYFSGLKKDEITIIKFSKDQQLVGATLLKEEKGAFTFLSDLKTDANFFVFREGCTSEDFDFFFSSLLQKAETMQWAFELNNIPTWAKYMDTFQQCLFKTKLFSKNIKYSVCPVIDAGSSSELLKIVTRTHKHRYPYNKLLKQLNAEFEILTDNWDLENWVKDFCNTHLNRWQNTPTPSSFRNKNRQVFFLNCLKAWCRDNILVRFAVKVNSQRIGFVVGLREKNSLIHHSTTFNIDYRQFAPGKALIYVMANWMQQSNLGILDFGDGDEEYKYFFANKEQVLNRIIISSKKNYRFILKAKLISTVRKNSRLYNFYRNKLKIYFTR